MVDPAIDESNESVLEDLINAKKVRLHDSLIGASNEVDTTDVPECHPPTTEDPPLTVSSIDLSITLTRGMESPLLSLLTDSSWQTLIGAQFSEMYMHDLTRFLHKERIGKKFFPPIDKIFASLNACNFDDIKVVILGQDPYHDDGQAMGLSFSVPSGFKLPSSLLNIYKEIETDLSVPRSKCGDLTKWSQQGVLLLNAVLTVRPHEPNSHKDKGWERFTDHVVRQISEKNKNVVFLLWGKFAEQKAAKVNRKNHLVLTAAHPSGLSASRGFFGCKHFSKANEYLRDNGREEINWALDE